ncbi:MAG: ATP-dependent DNA ligase [Chloroflexota bacterium]|nr:ATP-dependent DNA ligase [Chloroflexota bacterium]
MLVTFAQAGPSVAFETLAMVAERVRGTTKKLAKMALLADYFATLGDSDLAIAARYIAGQVFPQHDMRVLQVGGAAIVQMLVALSGRTREEIAPLSVRLGELGEVARTILPGHLSEESALTLAAVAAAIEALAITPGTKAKTALLTDLVRRATPLEATYLVKLVAGDLRIGLKQGLVEDALARGFDRPRAAVSHAAMLLGDLGEVAVLARAGALDRAMLRLFHPLGAMLATPAASPEEALANLPEGWALVEDKFDGIRAQVHRDEDRLAIYSRTLDEITHRFPELHAPLLALPGPFVLDGEIIGEREGRVLPFTRFQQRLGRKAVTEAVLRDIPAVLIAFDLLYRDGDLLFARPLTERRTFLADLLQRDDISVQDERDDPQRSGTGDEGKRALPLRLSRAQRVTTPEEIETLFAAARARGNEGLMVKLPHSAYTPGRRGAEWRKVKRALASLDVVVTAVEWGHGKRRHVLSDYTFAVRTSESDPTLLNIGKAYSGLTDAEIAALTQWFLAHTRQDYGRARTVEPAIILEVTFDAVQESTRHKSGYALRFPRILRVRDDKPLDEVDTLVSVRALAGQESGR